MCKKSDVLDAGGYFFDYWHCAYVNRSKKALFSHLFVDAHSAEELEAIISKTSPGPEWQFFGTEPVSEDVRQKVLARYA
jgi:hypothetical protein